MQGRGCRFEPDRLHFGPSKFEGPFLFVLKLCWSLARLFRDLIVADADANSLLGTSETGQANSKCFESKSRIYIAEQLAMEAAAQPRLYNQTLATNPEPSESIS